jgi:hypothetical protein
MDRRLELADVGCMSDRALATLVASERAPVEIAVGSVMKRRLLGQSRFADGVERHQDSMAVDTGGTIFPLTV